MINEDLLLWESVKFLPPIVKGRRNIRIHVYCGGQVTADNPQEMAFRKAWLNVKEHMSSFLFPNILDDPEYKHVTDLKADGWIISDLIDWLLEADIHFILCHIHQGFGESSFEINMTDMIAQLKRLFYHNGFPMGEHLMCPVFTQDKKNYLTLLGDMANPTMFIDMKPSGSISTKVLADLRRFCVTYTEGKGYVLKAPFTTNGDYVWRCKGFDVLERTLQQACVDLYGSIPYVIIQPFMHNSREHKFTCWDGIPRYLAYSHIEGKSFSKPPHTEAFLFIKAAIARVKEQCPYLLSDGLFRVDLFQCQDGRLVVNEFESLEAGFGCKYGSWEHDTREFLRLYLAQKLIDCIAKVPK